MPPILPRPVGLHKVAAAANVAVERRRHRGTSWQAPSTAVRSNGLFDAAVSIRPEAGREIPISGNSAIVAVEDSAERLVANVRHQQWQP
jgi:hypothetical protein